MAITSLGEGTAQGTSESSQLGSTKTANTPSKASARAYARRVRLTKLADLVARVADLDSGSDAHSFLTGVCALLSESGLYRGVWTRLLGATSVDTIAPSSSVTKAPPSESTERRGAQFAPCVLQAVQANSLVLLPSAKANCRACPFSEDCDGTPRVILGLSSDRAVHGVLSIGLLSRQRLGRQEAESLQNLAAAIAARLDDIVDLRRLRGPDEETSDLYRTVFECTGTAMWIVDNQGLVSLVNRKFEAMTGYSRQDVEGKLDWERLFAPEDLPAMREIRAKRLAGDPSAPEQYEARVVAKDGTAIPVLKTSALIPHTRSVLSSLMDMTQEQRAVEAQREAEAKAQQAQRLAAVGEMAAGVAHEINNPVTGIIGFAEMLTQQPIPDDSREYASLILEAGQRVATIVEQLLSFARWRTPTRVAVDLNRLVENTAHQMEPCMTLSEITLVLRLGQSLPPVLADSGQLGQVISNIISNAHTAMLLAHGSGTITIRTAHRSGKAILEFEDTGPGIPDEHIDKIFDPFFTTRDVGQGTGLGLSICHGIVSEHGGRIRARNNRAGGATFTVELPLAASIHSLGYANTRNM